MKNRYIILVVLSSILTFSSCNFLNVDNYFSDEVKLDEVFAYKRNIEAYMWGIASSMPDEGALFANPYTPGPLATDEAFTMLQTAHGLDGMSFVLGEITADNLHSFGSWYGNFYMMIRKCNTLLSRIDEAQDLDAVDRARIIANTKFFRAYSYYNLLLNFGSPIIVGDEVIPSNETIAYYDRPRSTYDEAVEYICNELEEAAKLLPVKLPLMEFGRPTKGAAYGLIARLRLYHASPLYNGGAAAQSCFGGWKRKKDGANYVSLQYDEKRWAIAAAAAKRVIDMQNAGAPLYQLYTVPIDSQTPPLPTNVTTDPNYTKAWPEGAAGIDHFKSYSEIFNGEAVIPANPEYVWGRRSGSIVADTRFSFPAKNGGFNGLSVTQKVIDAFSMVDGRPINNSSPEYPYTETGFSNAQTSFSGYRLNSGVYNMYVNREMRFYASIGFSEGYWSMSTATSAGDYNKTITYYYDAQNGKSNNEFDYPGTGYVIKKFIHPSDARQGTNSRIMEKAYGIIRLADVLLMYAEALNNLTTSHTIKIGDQDVTIQRDPEEIRKSFNKVRYRAGLPGLTSAELADPITIQQLIEKERMVELLFENHRYFDVRRWGIYEKTESEPIMGMNADGGKDVFYSRVIPSTSRIGARVVSKKMVFLPIPLSEVRKLPSLDQNPGWGR